MNLDKFSPVNSHSGTCSRYIKISETHGVKLFRSATIRDLNYKRQCVAYAHDIGVAADGPFETDWCGIHWYGFRTEHVEEIASRSLSFAENRAARLHITPIAEQCFGLLCNGDYHSDNIGRHKGKYVAVDFSHQRDKFNDNLRIYDSVPTELCEDNRVISAYVVPT